MLLLRPSSVGSLVSTAMNNLTAVGGLVGRRQAAGRVCILRETHTHTHRVKRKKERKMSKQVICVFADFVVSAEASPEPTDSNTVKET